MIALSHPVLRPPANVFFLNLQKAGPRGLQMIANSSIKYLPEQGFVWVCGDTKKHTRTVGNSVYKPTYNLEAATLLWKNNTYGW